MIYDFDLLMRIIICSILSVYLILLKYSRIKFNILHLFFMLILPIGVGYQVLDSTGRSRIAGYFWLSFLSLSFGYILMGFVKFRALYLGSNAVRYSAERVVAAAIIIISAYHIYALGVPILRSDVEISRFSFGDSGFFGIPSRVFLIVFPIFAIYTLQKYIRIKSKESYKIMAFTWICLFILQIASGFKGALLTMLFLAIFSLVSVSSNYYFKDIIKFRNALYVLMGAFFAILVSFQYGSRNVTSFEGGISYIYERATTEAAEAGYIVFSEAKFGKTNYIVNDYHYFSSRYFGVRHIKEIFPSDRIISSKISKTPLDDRYFIVSVTTGLASLIYSDYGIFATLIVFLLLGILMRLAKISALQYYVNQNFIASSILTYIIYNIYVVIVNGNPVYWIINTTIGCAIFIILFCISEYLIRLRRK